MHRNIGNSYRSHKVLARRPSLGRALLCTNGFISAINTCFYGERPLTNIIFEILSMQGACMYDYLSVSV